jgi:hypothetical protein
VAPKTKKSLLKMQKELRQNTPIVRRKLTKAGKRAPRALVSAVARHFKALDRLAKE